MLSDPGLINSTASFSSAQDVKSLKDFISEVMGSDVCWPQIVPVQEDADIGPENQFLFVNLSFTC